MKGGTGKISEDYIAFDKVKTSYVSEDTRINALSDTSFHINKGEFCVLLDMSITDPSPLIFWVSIGLAVGISVISFLIYFIWKRAKKTSV